VLISGQDWIWILIFFFNWKRTGSGYLFDFYNEISLRVTQDVSVTIDGATSVAISYVLRQISDVLRQISDV